MLLALILITAPAFADFDLAPLVKQGTPGDLLMEDPVAPSWSGVANPASGSGTLQKSLSDELALPVVSTAAPGAYVQLRGLGRSAEDTDVQALGVPLNPPQGGGFDLSIFPQFLWATYNYRPGPALGTFDPRGTGGSLTLIPWTAWALEGNSPQGRVATLASSARVFQLSAAQALATGEDSRAALVAGLSGGDAEGPSAAFSTRWILSARHSLTMHLMMTDLDAKTPGPGGITPQAHQQTVRGIPLVQLDTRIGDDGLLKSSIYFDATYLKYEDPAASALPGTQDHTYQLGTESAFLWGAWKFGAGLRGIRYQTLRFGDQEEAVGHLLVSRVFEPGPDLLIEPVARAVAVSRYGVLPEASLGVRGKITSDAAWFARTGLSRHFPSMINRFYSYPGFPGRSGFIGNPELAPERDWTGIAGLEWNSRFVHAGLEAYAQFTEDAQVRAPLDAVTDTELNLGNARVGSLLGRVQVAPMGWLDLSAKFTLSASRIDQTGLAFAGLPPALAVFSVGVHSGQELAGGGYRWEMKALERVSSDSAADSVGARLPSYHEENLEFRARFGDNGSWIAVGRVDDVSDQRPELVSGYRSFGRVFSVLVSRGF